MGLGRRQIARRITYEKQEYRTCENVGFDSRLSSNKLVKVVCDSCKKGFIFEQIMICAPLFQKTEVQMSKNKNSGPKHQQILVKHITFGAQSKKSNVLCPEHT